ADICNKVGIIERGELLVNADVAEVMRKVRDHLVILVELAERMEDAAKLLEQHPSVNRVEIATVSGHQHLRVALNKEQGLDDYSDLPTLLVQNGFKIRSFKEDEINLETAFMTLTKGMTA
ncbi:MAG: multidrug ABC transporter ATP-binding protein, partial [Planctomycetaceae bacterium]|nr:multidrug ABC transporter ATP-binding protein [Planctomycetaceae bacterium]